MTVYIELVIIENFFYDYILLLCAYLSAKVKISQKRTLLSALFGGAFALLYPLFVKAFANAGLQMAMAVFVTFFVLWAHRHNFRRVQESKEEKFYFSGYLKKKKAEAEDDDE